MKLHRHFFIVALQQYHVYHNMCIFTGSQQIHQYASVHFNSSDKVLNDLHPADAEQL